MRDLVGVDTCIERKCVFEFEGRSFEAGGAFIGVNPKTGKHGGIVYAFENEKRVGNWHGDIKTSAHFGREWISVFGDKRQSVYFQWKGINFYGVYYKSGSDIVRVREIRG